MTYDVVVAGAGPVGLFLAAELRLGGASVLVLERERDPVRPAKAGSMGARALNVPTVAALHLRGLLPEVRKAALFWFDAESPPGEPDPDASPVFVGHFAGIDLRADRLDFADPDVTPDPLGAGVVAQQDLENVLAAHAAGLGVEIRRGVALTGFEADGAGVTIRTGEGQVRAGWLVGCDGGRSTVRKLAGFGFPGADAVFTGRQAIVEMTGDEGLVRGDWQRSAAGSYVVGGWGEDAGLRIHTVEFVPPEDRDAEITAGELEASLRRVSGVDVTITKVHAATRYADTTRQAETYRRGRVLLAGDAAHVHSPAGGQGLNLGLGDALNLGWKLASVARGFAPETLLETYTAERHPIGAWVQDWTLAQTAVSHPGDPRAEAMRGVLTELLDTPQGTTYVVKKISGAWQRYDLAGDHPLIGTRAPEMALTDGTRFTDHTRHGQAIVLDGLGGAAAEVAAKWGDRVAAVRARPVEYADTPVAAFIRPDGYVAWAGHFESDVDGLEAVVATWLG